MSTNNSDKLYKDAIKILEIISVEMQWLYANYQVFQTGGEQEIVKKITNTYSGHIWKLLRRTNLNEIHLVLYKLIDPNPKTASLFNLKDIITKPEVISIMKNNYTQAEGTFDYRLEKFEKAFQDLNNYMKDKESTIWRLIKYRHNYLAHRNARPYKNSKPLKVGDEKELIEIIEKILNPIEHLLLNSGNVSYSTNASYKLYSKNFWNSLSPEKEKDHF